MSNQETVELTIKVPKCLIDLLENEHYFKFDRAYFWEAMIRSFCGVIVGNMHYTEEAKFYEKYGNEIDTYYLPESLDP